MSCLQEDFKKVLLAGLGAAAVTAEKSKEIVNELVKKGELTLEQGRILNEELKHAAKNNMDGNGTVPDTVEGIKQAVDKLSPQELEEVKEKIADAEARQTAEGKKKENAQL
jgi:polyhydroxyalkanoate synthesis regulator phasin